MEHQTSSYARAEGLALFSILHYLHQWEVEQSELLRSTTGRHLYFSIAHRALVLGKSTTVKEVITTTHLTDRALRMRLSQWVEEGWLIPCAGSEDARTRSLKPSHAFENLMHTHIDVFRKLANLQFMLIEKENLNTLPDAHTQFINPIKHGGAVDLRNIKK